MELKGKVVVVTGGGSGIGAALCRRFAQEGARAVVVVDIHVANAEKVAAEVQGLGVACNVAVQAEVPLGVAFFDYGRKRVGVQGYLQLSGSRETDLAAISSAYDGVVGRHPDLAAPIALKGPR